MRLAVAVALLSLATWCSAQETARNCTKEDIGTVFTQCFGPTSNRQRQVVQYWKHSCTPVSDVELAEAQTVACSKDCIDGEFYSAEKKECDKCKPGTYSFRGLRVNWREWPDGMTTYCQPEGACSPWSMPKDFSSGTLIWSGDQSAWSGKQKTIESSLVYNFRTVTQGSFRILFKTDCDWDDGLYLHVNGTLYKYNGKTELGSGPMITMKTVKVDLPVGHHQIKLVYISNDGGDKARQDAAFIRSIEVEGVANDVTSCSPCPLAEWSEAGKPECYSCPIGEKRVPGDEGCTKCPEGQWSHDGETCIDEEACTEDDFVPTFGSCKDGKRTKTWRRINFMCKDGTDFTSRSEEVDCAPCMAGYHRREGICVPCGEGEAGPSCTPCEKGTTAIQAFTYGWETLEHGLVTKDGLFQTSCNGDQCSAWEVLAVKDPKNPGQHWMVLASGLNRAATFNSTLDMQLDMKVDGYLDFEYFFTVGSKRGLFLPEYVTGTVEVVSSSEGAFMLHLEATKEAPRKFSEDMAERYDASGQSRRGLEIKNGARTVRWNLRKKNTVQDVTLNIKWLKVVGAGGSAAECTPCPLGHSCKTTKDLPTPCPLGYYQDEEKQTECKKCEGNSAAHRPGQSQCRECKRGTRANTNNTLCVSACTFSDPTGTFDFTPIGHKLLGPAIQPKQLENMKQRGLCSDVDPTKPGPIDVGMGDGCGLHRYFLKVCEMVNDEEAESKVACPTQGLKFHDDSVDPGYMCQRINNQRAYSLGDEVEYTIIPDVGVNMSLTGGDECTFDGRKVDRSAQIQMQCDLSIDPNNTNLNFEKEDFCTYYFWMKTPLACPTCTEKSFVAVDSPCDADGMAMRKWIVNETCYGGVPHPEPKKVSCMRPCVKEDYVMQWGECVEEKRKAFYVLPDGVECKVVNETKPVTTETRSCIAMTIKDSKVAVTAIAITCIVIALLMCLCVTCRKKAELENRYARLAQERDNVQVPDGQELVLNDEVEMDHMENP